MPSTYRALVVSDDPKHAGLASLQTLLDQRWEPAFLSSMGSAVGGGEGALFYAPTCLVILKAPVGYQAGDEQLPHDEDRQPVRPDPEDDDTAAPTKTSKPAPKGAKALTKAITPKAKAKR